MVRVTAAELGDTMIFIEYDSLSLPANLPIAFIIVECRSLTESHVPRTRPAPKIAIPKTW